MVGIELLWKQGEPMVGRRVAMETGRAYGGA